MTHKGCKSFGRRQFLWAGWWPWVRWPGSRSSSVTDVTGRPWTSQFPSWASIPLMAMKDGTTRLQTSFLKAYKMACWQKQWERELRGREGLENICFSVLCTSFPCCHWPPKKGESWRLKVLQSFNAWSVQEGSQNPPLHHCSVFTTDVDSSSFGPGPHMVGNQTLAASCSLHLLSPPSHSWQWHFTESRSRCCALGLVAGMFPFSLPMTSFS